jgi:hypothetical protein
LVEILELADNFNSTLSTSVGNKAH